MENFLREGVDMGKMGSSGDGHFFEDSITPSKVRAYLDSVKEAEKLKGMKWLLAMLSKGRDVSEFFPDVVKIVVVKSVEVKKMVYIFLVHYADYDAGCREIALLSINSFQKDMSGANQLIRGLALRVMTSIRVPDIIQIQLLAVRKCATDSSPYVRKCAAVALTKIYSLDPEQLSNLKQILDKLLRDSSTMVLGSAVAAFNEICPSCYEILHRSYRKLCHLLADMDEWTQVSVLEVMTRYVRNQFTDPAPGVAAAVRLQAKQRSTSAVKGRIGNTIKRRVVRKAFYSDEEDESDEEEVEVDSKPEPGSVFAHGGGEGEHDGDVDPDHRLVLRSSLPLLKSRNSGVVLGVCALHYYCGSQSSSTTQQLGKALVRILRNRREIQYVVLTCISTMAQQRPMMFRPFLSDFFIKGSDPVFNRLLKLEILTSICTKDNIQQILRELQNYIKQGNQRFVCAAIRAVGRVVDADPDTADLCMEGLMHLMLCNKTDLVVGETVVVLRQLLQQNSASETSTKILNQLVKMLIADNGIDEALARSSIVWLVGEFHDKLAKVAPDVLRVLAAGFMDESTETKTQILNLAIKQALLLPDDDNVQALMQYVLELARYDLDTDLRDRSRFMTALMGLAPSNESEGAEAPVIDEDALGELNEHAMGIMLSPKLPPVTLLGSVDVEGLPNFNVGSLSSLVGHYISGYEPLSSWPDTQPDPNVRDALRLNQQDSEPSQILRTSKGKNDNDSDSDDKADLTDFYGEAADSDEDDDDEDDDEDDDDEEDDDDDDDDDDEDDDDDDDDDDDEDEDDEDEESESSEEEVARIPIRQAPQGGSLQRQGMRKVATANKNKVFSDDLSLLPQDFDALTLQPAAGTSSSSSSTSAAGMSSNSSADDMFLLSGGTFSSSSSLAPPAAPAPAPVAASSSSGMGMSAFDDVFASSMGVLQPQQTNAQMANIMQTFDSSSSVASMAPQQPVSSISTMPSPERSSTNPNMMMPMQQQGYPMSMQMGAMGGMQPQMQMGGYPMQMQMGGGMMMMQQQQQQQQQQQMMMGGGGVPMVSAAGGGGGVAAAEVLSEPKMLLSPELAGGFSISMVFRYGAQASTYAGAFCTYLILKNSSDVPLRRIKISFPADLRRTAIEDIAQLNPGQEMRVPVEMALSGLAGKTFRVDVRNDKGAYVGSLAPELHELLYPLVCSPSDFDMFRKRITGLGAAEKVFSLASLGLSPGPVVEMELIARVKKCLNVYLVQGAGVGELMFAACSRKAMMEEKALITLLSDSENVTVRFHCEDAVLSSSLLDVFKRALVSL